MANTALFVAVAVFTIFWVSEAKFLLIPNAYFTL